MQRIQMQLSKKQKNLSQFFSAFLKSSSKFEHFKKHDEHHSLHISQITDWKTWLDKCLQSLVSENPLTSNMLNGSKTVEIYKTATLSYLLITANEIVLKKSVLVTSKFLGLFVNTLTADDKYSVFIRDVLTQSIQMQLSKKQKSFLSTFFCIFKI